MKAGVVKQLQRVKRLHADRAEQEQRRRQAALEAAAGAVAHARATLASWREAMPARQEAIYATVIGQVVDLVALEGVQAQIVALREHDRVLQQRVTEAEAAATEARKALEAATAATALARRALTKFDELMLTLRRAAALAGERREDAELEESVELRPHPDDAGMENGGTEDGDGCDQAA